MHTKEPWLVASGTGTMIITQDRVPCIAQTANENAIADARRIVACVNACAGISTENLEDNIPIVDGLHNLNKQRDELLSALKEISTFPRYRMPADIAKEAIAKADLTQ